MRLTALLSAATALIALSAALAGPLNPPAGAVTATGKTLTEVEPRTAINAANTPGDFNSVFKITQPGSYYLTANVAGVAGKYGIEVAADFVTIDLNGFSMVGTTGSFDAIKGDGGPQQVSLTVKNGTISGWTNGSGFYAGGLADCRAEDLRITGVGFEGVWLGARAVINRCIVRTTRGGLRTGANSFVRDSASEGASERGILTGNECLVSGCTVKSAAIVGISAEHFSTVENCSVRAGVRGVEVLNNSVVRGVTVWDCSAIGIFCADGATVSDCTVIEPGASGISTYFNATVSRCTVNDAGGHGIIVQAESTVTDSFAVNCSADGVHAAGGCVVSRCTAIGNSGNGVFADLRCAVTGNYCESNGNGNGSAGVRIDGNGCRVENNACYLNGIGISVQATGSVILRNTCGGNTTNWLIAANNAYGPIIDRTAPASAAVSGNSAPDASGSTHPNANFSH